MREATTFGIIYWYIRGSLKGIIMNCLLIIIFLVVFTLYALPLEPILYGLILYSCGVLVYCMYDFYRFYRKHRYLFALKDHIAANMVVMPTAQNLIEQDYQRNFQALYNQYLEAVSKNDAKQTEMMDYYTLWAHQIKTPIAAIGLLLQSTAAENNTELIAQIFKIEQYVEMGLNFVRIENTTSDLVLQSYSLADIVKQGIRKYANVFIRKNIALEFKEMSNTVLTDEKWLVFVIEQLLSNALKYTNKGKIAIYMADGDRDILVIEDTGIGIAEEDLPRVFEKGFTGYNGRMDKKATGIGLYLCSKVLDKLSHKITITSSIDVGTKVRLDLSSVESMIE